MNATHARPTRGAARPFHVVGRAARGLPRSAGRRQRRRDCRHGAPGRADQAAGQPRPAGRAGRLAGANGAATRRGSARSTCWCSPATTASPCMACRRSRPRSPRRWWRIFPPAAPRSTSLRKPCRRRFASFRSISNSRPPISRRAAMDEASFLAAVAAGYGAVRPDADLVCLGEMGIGNTTAAAAIAAALFGGGGARWAGRGTGLDDRGLARKQEVIDQGAGAARRHSRRPAAGRGGARRTRTCGHPRRDARRAPPAHSGAARRLRLHRRRGAAGPTAGRCARSCAGRACVGRSRPPRAAEELNLRPLLDLGMRLGEGSGAALAVSVLRAALACHDGMATFAEAGVANKSH